MDLLLISFKNYVIFTEKGADYPVKVGGVDISPDSIARGKSATFTISANTGKGSCYACFLSSFLYHFSTANLLHALGNTQS